MSRSEHRGSSWLAQGEQAVAEAQDRRIAQQHRCHAEGCEEQVPPSLLMCRAHWFMVRKALRREVWRLYVSGQEERKDPSREYLAAAKAAIAAVAACAGRQPRLPI